MLTSVYPRSAEDAEVPWLRETVNRLRQRGIEVCVVAPSWRGLQSHEVDGCPVVRFRYGPRNWEILTHDEGAPNKIRSRPWLKLLAVPYVISALFSLMRCCLRQRFDFIQAHWPFPHGVPAAFVATLLRKPLILTFHGAELAMARKSGVIRFVLRRCLARADLVSANSGHTKAQVRRIAPVEVRVIPYGTPIQEEAGRSPLSAASSVFRILFVGRHIERKGLPVLIRAVENLGEAFPWELEIIGDGDQSPLWRQMAAQSPVADRIHFRGKVSTTELVAAYRRANVFVLPAIIDRAGDTEGLGVVLVEAITYGVPVIASDAGGIPDVIRDGETGYLVTPGDAQALAKALRTAHESEVLNRTLTANAKRHIQEHFNWDRIIDQWCAIFENRPLVQ